MSISNKAGLNTFGPVSGAQINWKDVTSAGVDSANILVGTAALTANANYYVGFECDTSLALYNTNNLATTECQLYDSVGNALTSAVNNTASAFLYNIVAGTSYLLRVKSSVASAASLSLITLSGKITPTVFYYFADGFEPSSPLPSGITVVENGLGELTYTFTNYAITAGESFIIGATGIASNVGTLTITSSNPAQIPSVSQPTVVNGSYVFQLLPSVTASFTGTVVISCSGVGVEVNISTPAFPAPAITASSSSSSVFLSSKQIENVDENRVEKISTVKGALALKEIEAH